VSMQQIVIDFDVHKFIEQHRTSFEDTPNDVLRRHLLGLSSAPKRPEAVVQPRPGFHARGTFLPAGMTLRKVLKGVPHEAEVVDGGIRYKGKTFDSPSAAACAAAGNSVNGWAFWDYFDQATGRCSGEE